jgi:hypothetical protein
MNTRELERLLDRLGKLSEDPLASRVLDGRTLDMIGEVREACYELLDAR